MGIFKTLCIEARERISNGEDGELLCCPVRNEWGEIRELSNGITLAKYQEMGYPPSYRSLAYWANYHE